MRKIYAVGAAVIAVVLIVAGARTNTGSYGIAEVFDGDTVSVNMDGTIEKVRLIGVDTPETKDPRKPVQCYGPEASVYSHTTLTGKRVKLVADPLSTNRDRYDRLLRYVYLTDGTLYNQALLEKGYARAYLGFPFSKRNQFEQTAKTAQQSKTGLWASCQSAV